MQIFLEKDWELPEAYLLISPSQECIQQCTLAFPDVLVSIEYNINGKCQLGSNNSKVAMSSRSTALISFATIELSFYVTCRSDCFKPCSVCLCNLVSLIYLVHQSSMWVILQSSLPSIWKFEDYLSSTTTRSSN